MVYLLSMAFRLYSCLMCFATCVGHVHMLCRFILAPLFGRRGGPMPQDHNKISLASGMHCHTAHHPLMAVPSIWNHSNAVQEVRCKAMGIMCVHTSKAIAADSNLPCECANMICGGMMQVCYLCCIWRSACKLDLVSQPSRQWLPVTWHCLLAYASLSWG